MTILVRRALSLCIPVLILWSSAANAQPARRPQQPRDATRARATAVGTGAISGSVLVAGSGSPARNVRVTLSGDEPRFSRSTSTDEQGRFSFTALPAGRFTLSAAKAGHVTTIFGQRRPGTPGTQIQLAEGQQFQAQIQMPRGGVLTGVVLDEYGDAPAGTAVRALRYVSQNGQRTLQAAGNGTTDDRGIYRIYGLQPGEYVVCATPRPSAAAMFDQLPSPVQALAQSPALAPMIVNGLGVSGAEADAVRERLTSVQQQLSDREEATAGYAAVCYPGTTVVSRAGSVALGISEEKPGIDFQLQRVPLARIEGTVIAASGMTLQNVQVSLVDAQGRNPIGTGPSARVDANGAFRLNGVAPGQYTLRARMQVGGGGRGMAALQGAMLQGMLGGRGGGRGGRGAQGAAAGSESEVYWASLDLTVDGRPISNLALTLVPGLTLSGQVSFDGGTPPADLSRVRVSLNAVEGNPLLGAASGTLDADGRFTVRGLTPGLYRIGVGGAAGWSPESAMIGSVDGLDFPIEVKPGDAMAPVTITMTNKLSEVAGFVVNSAYQPAVDYTVVLFPADAQYWGVSARRVRTARPATDGRYAITNLPPGDYRVAPALDIDPAATADPAFLQQLESSSTRFTLQPGEKKVQDVRVGGGPGL